MQRRFFLKLAMAVGVAASGSLAFLQRLFSVQLALASSRSGARTKVICLGLDGMDPNLLRQYMDAGVLPNFSRLVAAGDFKVFGTSIPPQSPVAWSNFITGQDPGGHGIFDFIHRDPETLIPKLSISEAKLPDDFFKLGCFLPAEVRQFRCMFDGLIWVEVMLVRGVNDGEGALLGIRRALEQIEPDRVYVNIPIRPPAESWAEPPDAEGLVRAHAILGEAVFIDQPESGTFGTSGGKDPMAALLAIVRRHPLRRQQVLETLASLASDEVESTLRQLERAGKIQKITYRGETYYAEGQGRYHGR